MYPIRFIDRERNYIGILDPFHRPDPLNKRNIPANNVK